MLSANSGKRRLQVGNEIAHGLQADIEAHDRRAVVREAPPQIEVRHYQADHSAPAVADLEELELVEQTYDDVAGYRGGKFNGKNARRAGKIPLPDFMSRAAGESGVTQSRCLRLLLQPPGNRERALLELLQPDGKRLQSSYRQTAIVRRGAHSEQLTGIPQRLIVAMISGGNGPEQYVTVAAYVFGERLHGHVDAGGESVEENSCRIGIVQRRHDASLTRSLGYGPNILHFHRDRSWALTPDQLGCRPQQMPNVRPDQRIVILGLDSES